MMTTFKCGLRRPVALSLLAAGVLTLAMPSLAEAATANKPHHTYTNVAIKQLLGRTFVDTTAIRYRCVFFVWQNNRWGVCVFVAADYLTGGLPLWHVVNLHPITNRRASLQIPIRAHLIRRD